MNLTDPVVEEKWTDVHRRSICVRSRHPADGVVFVAASDPADRPDRRGLVPRVLARTSSLRERRGTPDLDATLRTASLIWGPLVDLGEHRSRHSSRGRFDGIASSKHQGELTLYLRTGPISAASPVVVH